MTPDSERHSSVVRSAGVVSAGVMLSRLTGLAREIAFARLFGASAVNDAFTIGVRIPNLTRDLFAEGALSSAFVPTFTSYLATRGKREAAHLSNLVATAVILVVGAICVAGMIWSPQLVRLFAGKFAEVPGKFELAVRLTRIMFPFLLLVALAAQAMGVLNASGRFGMPALASSFFNVGSLAFGLAAGYWAGPRLGFAPIEGMAYGFVFGGALQLFCQIPGLARCGFVFRPAIDWRHPGLRHIFALMGPAVLGNAAVQVNVLVNTSFAAGITDASGQVMNGPVSWLLYAFRFMQLPLGLFGVAIASATLPAISRSAAVGNTDEFRRTLSRSLGLVFLLTVPSSVGLAALGEPLIAAIYQGGAFRLSDTRQTALALACYSIGLAGYAAVKVLAPAFYALHDARTPMTVSVISIAINYFAASTMIKVAGLGHAGLALSTSIVAIFNFLALLWAMRARVNGIHGRELLSTLVKVAAASLAMGAACYGSSHWVRQWLGIARWARLADLAISISLGVAVFYAAARALKVAELEMAWTAVAGPLARRLRMSRDKME
ncbi:MAG TPA: murein biosynthesis integral membrane protein MurJ [Bryobacteraceae bacterium]|nr:murein biosynthesis integral membrane protein MurJ [Bryobacteraceae bacterium]